MTSAGGHPFAAALAGSPELERPKALEAILLQHEVEGFYYDEAELLDRHQYQEWVELFAPEARYRVPVRSNRTRREQHLEVAGPNEQAYFDETADSLRWRLRRFDTGQAWSEDPPSRTRHLVTNIRAEARTTATGESVLAARSNFLVYRNRLQREVDVLAGERHDVLRRSPQGTLRIVDRLVLLDQSVLLAKNLSTFL